MSGIQTPASPAGNEIETTTTPADGEQGAVADANSTASSTVDDEGAKEERTLLSVVQDAVAKPDTAAVASPNTDGEGEAEAAATEAKPEGEADADADDDANLPFHTHPRWQQVVAERDSYKEEAQNYQAIQAFVQENGLTGEEVAEGYEVMALLKRGDPQSIQKALEWFEPRVEYLRNQIGAVLPDDLADRVESGELDEADAAEIARGRATARLTEETATRQAEQAEAARVAQAQTAAQNAITASVDAWEVKTKAADPDYAKKSEMVRTFLRAAVQERGGKPPASPEEAVQLANAAYARVNETFASLLPKPREVKPSPTGVSTTTTVAPDTLRGAIMAALNQ